VLAGLRELDAASVAPIERRPGYTLDLRQKPRGRRLRDRELGGRGADLPGFSKGGEKTKMAEFQATPDEPVTRGFS